MGGGGLKKKMQKWAKRPFEFLKSVGEQGGWGEGGRGLSQADGNGLLRLPSKSSVIKVSRISQIS